ncbi:mCpol domain-containing protein [Rhizobium phaseoli]|uniref:mCpol domain-containing protein n=1 Tax=Rhizobium phaseoli TaxID=396 RepID=UPI000BE89C57|nr:mCpol domain-containing protein [Rhizobium phaseoli]PDS31318.1 hypothetical protein CO650_11050 [Rhizobium phaseoli]
MAFISVDGDDIGRRITALYLTNDREGLTSFVGRVHANVRVITDILENAGHEIIFSAADGVVAEIVGDIDTAELYKKIADVGAPKLTFSAGVGDTLQECYVALLAAKSEGKARLRHFKDIG